jgi:UDP-3-O-[3-hydroxymyristoyl] glucosamine N-acyltransferase
MFYQFSMTAGDIAVLLGCEVIGDQNALITGLNRIEDANEGEISFISSKEFEKYLPTTKASCLIATKAYKDYEIKHVKALIVSENPYIDFVKLLIHINSKITIPPSGIHPSAIIGESVNIAPTASIGPNCVVGTNSSIGENSVLLPGVILYYGVKIGNNTILNSNVVCYSDTQIGNNCIIHSGTVIGSDGFGFIENKDGSYVKIPQLGNVVIEDNVEIGANTTIDRSVVGTTLIEKGVKIDNLVQIAHNVKIGENTGIVSPVGIAGSIKSVKRNRIGGQVGFAGHLETTDDVTILARSAAHKSIEKPGTYFGTPLKERMEGFRQVFALERLPELIKDVEEIKKLLKIMNYKL